MSADHAQLMAGGLVPTSAKLGKADAVDVVVARAYRHPVLPGRAVIRLVAEGVAAGDDLEMATLGFAAGEDRGAVGKERKRALGFPGWALVNDPKNARYALDVVKELKGAARRVKSKPGAAKESIDKIAATLAKTVPHFLPSFYEEAGRAFLEHGAASFAATYFGKAREAEAVHALEVDEQHRVDAFLEFALAGAVTTKALSQYAKDLAEHHEPADAYAHFRKLCVQRTLGGMPPWAGMAKDLQRLAKAAKLDVAAEDRAVVAEVIGSPALSKAAGEFWRAYRVPIVELAKAQPAVRGTLLNLFPTGSAYSAELDEAWLELLDASGASDALVGEGDPLAQPTGGRAAWFDKLTQHLARNWRESTVPASAFVLLRRMAPKLVADGAPIRCLARHSQLDLDLCELALELGVEVTLVADPKRPWMTPRFQLEPWAKTADRPERGRDPVKTATHPLLGPALVLGVDGAIGKTGFDSASAGKAGFVAAKRAWLEQQLAAAERGALPDVTDTLVRLDAKAKPQLFADLPDLHARLAALDVAPALAKSLQIGAIDEYGWPALEAVMAELSDGKTQVMIAGGPPAVIVATKTKLVAVGANGRLGEHDLVIPAKCAFHTARFIGGQFLVALKEGYTLKAYWSANPSDVFVVPDKNVIGTTQIAAVTPDGAWLEEGTPIRVGDRTFPAAKVLRAFDGTTAWIADPDDYSRWREVTASGEKGRVSWPAVLEGLVEDDWKIDPLYSYVLPVGDRIGGVAVFFKGDGTAANTAIARKLVVIGGPTWTKATAMALTNLFVIPGGDPRPVTEHDVWNEGVQTTIWDPTCTVRGSVIGWKQRNYSRAQAAPLAPAYWHQYTLRDEAGSRRLRTTTPDDARALIAAIPVDANGEIPSSTPDEPIARALPEVSSQPLRNGITGFAIVAVKALQERDRLARERAPSMATAAQHAAPVMSDAAIHAALGNWLDRVWSKDGSTWRQASAIGAWFASDDRSDRCVWEASAIPATELDWFVLAPVRSVLAFAALAIGTPAEHRRPLAAMFGHLARTLAYGDKLRVYGLDGKHDFPGGSHNGVDLRWHAGNAYAVRKRSYNDLYRVLEYAPDGKFKSPPGGRIYDELRGTAGGLPVEALAELEAAIASGKTSWSQAVVDRIAAATGLATSAVAYLWAGQPNAHERSQNFLDKELREQLGLKATQAALGRDVIVTVRDLKRLAALEEGARAGVAAMLDGSAADAFATAWIDHVGKRIAVSEDLIAAADIDLTIIGASAHWLPTFAAPDEAPQLAIDPVYALDRAGDAMRTSSPEPLVGQDKLTDAPPAFDASTLHAATTYLPFLYAELPVGDDVRTAAARAHRQVLARLVNPALWFDAGAKYLPEDQLAAFASTIDGLGGTPLTGFGDDVRAWRVPGAVVTLRKTRAALVLHPATIDAKSQPLVAKLVATIAHGNNPFRALQYVRSPGLAQMMARIADTPVPVGGWEQNPALSVPTLVDKVAKTLGVSKPAAALYLQYLVLLRPTNKNLLEWNGWKPKQLADAQAELVAAELIIEAKRERALRAHFLPGAWDALKSPDPPLEAWKLPLYGMRDATGAARPMNGVFLALAPFHAMFEAAWQRIEDDDIPRYDEVKR